MQIEWSAPCLRYPVRENPALISHELSKGLELCVKIGVCFIFETVRVPCLGLILQIFIIFKQICCYIKMSQVVTLNA